MKKKIVTVIAVIAIPVLIISLYLVAGRDFSNNSLTTDEKKYQIYVLASTKGGYSGTYEEWLDSISGDELEIRLNGTNMQWKYKSEPNTSWKDLYDLEDYRGEAGSDGKDGLSAYEIWKEINGGGTEQEFLNSLKGEAGKDNTEGLYYIFKQFGYTGTLEQFKEIDFDNFDFDFGFDFTEYTLEYQLNGGSYDNLHIYKFSKSNPLVLSSPVKEGYNFAGWYDQDNKKYEVGTKYSEASKHLILSARWSAKEYNVNYVYNDILLGDSTFTYDNNKNFDLTGFDDYEVKYYSNRYLSKEITNITNDLISNNEVVVYVKLTLKVTNNTITFAGVEWDVINQSSGNVTVIAKYSVYQGVYDSNGETNYELSEICSHLNNTYYNSLKNYEKDKLVLTQGEYFANYFYLPTIEYLIGEYMSETWSNTGSYYFEGAISNNPTFSKSTHPIVTIKL